MATWALYKTIVYYILKSKFSKKSQKFGPLARHDFEIFGQMLQRGVMLLLLGIRVKPQMFN